MRDVTGNIAIMYGFIKFWRSHAILTKIYYNQPKTKKIQPKSVNFFSFLFLFTLSYLDIAIRWLKSTKNHSIENCYSAFTETGATQTLKTKQMGEGLCKVRTGWRRMADGGWRMADGGWRMADGGWRMADGG